MARAGLDAVWISDPANVRAVSGFSSGKDGKVLKLARGGDARYMLSVDAILSVDIGAKVAPGDILARV